MQHAPDISERGEPLLRPIPELGHYDQTAYKTRKFQGDLAKKYGIDGFLFHHFWFYEPNTTPGPTLAAPLLEMLEDNEPDLYFMLNWVPTDWAGIGENHSWNNPYLAGKKATRGQKQYFPHPNDPAVRAHYRFLRRFFRHPNYIHREGRPVLFIMDTDKVPASRPILNQFDAWLKDDGMEGIYVVGMRIQAHATASNHEGDPNLKWGHLWHGDFMYPLARGGHEVPCSRKKIPTWCQPGGKGFIYPRGNYGALITGFDETPRRSKNGRYVNCSVENFEHNVKTMMQFCCCCNSDPGDKIFFLNAWNEWSEGMVLEPSTGKGVMLLEAVLRAKEQTKDCDCPPGTPGMMNDDT